MKVKKIIKFIVFMFTVLIVMNVNQKKVMANSNYPDIPYFNKSAAEYMINYDIYKDKTNLWCIQEGSHLTSYHTCVYKEYGSEQTIDVTNETDENKIALAKAAMEYSSFTGEKFHSTEEATMQYFAQKVGFGGNYYNSGNSDKFLDYAKIIKKLNDLKNKSITLNATGKDGTYEVSFDEFSGLNSDEFKLTPSVVSGSGDVSIDPDGVINSNGKSATITIKNVPTGTKELKIKFSCKINGPTKLKYKTIKLAECTNSPEHKGKVPEPASVTARWGEVKGKLESAGCTKRESAGYELWNCGCPGQASMFVGDGPLNTLNLNVHNCVYHHYLNHINDWSINEQNLAMYYIEEGELEFEFEITITLEDTPGTLIIIKEWSGSGLPDSELPPITVNVKGPNGYNNNFELKPSNGWKVKIDELEDGEYTVTENTGNSEITYNGKKYTITYNSGSYTAKVGESVTIKNSYEGEDEPEPDPEPGEGDPDFDIEKKLVAVVSKLETPDRSSHNVQRGDKAIFEITVTNTKEVPEDEQNKEYEGALEGGKYPSEEVQPGDYLGSSNVVQNVDHLYPHYRPNRDGSWTTCDGFIYYTGTGRAYKWKKNKIKRKYYTRYIEYNIKEINLEDTIKESSPFLENAIYYEDADFTEYCIDGLNFKSDEGWDSSLKWTASSKEKYLKVNNSTKVYVVCDVKDVEKYKETNTNIARIDVGKLTWEKYIKDSYFVDYDKQIRQDTYYTFSNYNYCEVENQKYYWKDYSSHEGYDWKTEETEMREPVGTDEPEPEDVTNKEAKEDSDTVTMVGYEVSIKKKLTKVESELEKSIPVTEYVQLGDKLTYTITIENAGTTNTYQEFKITDILVDGIEFHKDNSSDWVAGGDGYENTSITGPSQSEVDGSVSRIATGETADAEFIAKVIGDPGTDVINKAVYNYFHNRNKIEIEANKEKKDQRKVDDYAVSVDKYITKAESKQTNSVGDEYQSSQGSRAGKQDGEKNGSNAYITDRGDTVTYKIVVKNEHDRTNIWKLTLEDEFNIDNLGKEPVLEYLKCTSNDWKVEVNGSKLTFEYSASEWSKPLAPGESVEIELKLLVIEGAELEDKGDTYQNKATITDIWNRNKLNESIENPGKKLLDFDTEHQHESSDWCTVRQINAVIDKYVSKVYGGIEGVVYNNESRKRKADTKSVYDSRENFKEQANVSVERGDEITYTFKIRNTGEGIITVMKLEDVFHKELIFNKFIGEKDWTCDTAVTAYNDKQNKLNITYTGWLNPGDEATLKLIFVMTNEEDDKYDLYGRNYINTLTTTEIQNINSWTWDNNGAKNGHGKDGTCKLEYLQNGEDGIPSNMSSSDYVYMLEYKVELDKYVINVKHTNDDGSEENYNNPGRKHYENGNEKNYDNVVAWKGKNDADTNRENWNDETKIAKSVNKEQYPVQVEKNDIVTYEIKIKNTNDESIPGDTSIYAFDIADIFSSEDGSDKTTNRITDNNIGLELMVDETKAENNNQLEILSTSSDKNQYLFKFTPKGQCSNSGKSTNGYGIGVNEVATFRIVVKVTRSNMYLYELRNTAVITSVYNRNNNIGNNDQDKQYTYSSTDTNRIVNDAYRVTNGNRAYILQNGSIVDQLTLNGLSKISKINEITLASEITVANKIADADYINLKDLIISGYVWDDTDPDNKEDGLMTWGAGDSTDAKVDGDVTVYLYRVNPEDTTETDLKGKLVMSTTVAEDGYYIFDNNSEVYSKENKPYLFEEENADKKFYDDSNSITVEQKYRFEPKNYIRPTIQVKVKNEEQIIKGQIIKGQDDKKKALTNQIYSDDGFTNYRIVKAPNKDYDNGTARYKYDSNKETKYYQYYVEFEYNGMKYTHTVYASNSVLNEAKGNAGNTNNEDGQYNLTERDKNNSSERWLPYRKLYAEDIKNIENYNSEYYEIDSNAAEFKSVREAFNNQFETVAYNKGIDPNANDTPLSYTTETDNSHVSRYNYTDKVKIRARSFITEWIDKVGPEETDTNKTYRNDSYKTFSATVGKFTNTLFFWDKHNTTRNPGYENIVGTTEETEYLKYINLGLKRRPIVDLELIKDVYNVQVDINGKTMVYEYNCVTPENLGRSDEDSTDAKYYTTGYKLYLYKSDYYYRYENYSNGDVQKLKQKIEPKNSELNPPSVIAANKEKEWLESLGFVLDNEKSESELNIQITYKYTITNKSGMPGNNRNELILGSINEIVDYHSADLIPNQTGRFVKQLKYPELENEKLNLVTEGTVYVATQYGAKKEEEKEKKKGLYKTINNIEEKTNDNFHTVYLSGFDGVKLYPEDSLDIYLTFTVSRTAFEFENTTENLKEAIKIGTKDNVAEISAFSTWYDSDSKYITNWSKNLETPGLIDKDSNPGDKAIDTISKASDYGDDTYKVDIGLELYKDDTGNKNGERLIDGLVWEDVKVNDKGVYFKNNPAKIIYETMQVVSDGLYHNTRKQANSPELDKDNDKTIDGMDVELIEIISDGDNVYEDRAEIYDENGKPISQLATETDGEGKYELKTYIPGNYVVRFKYGNDAEIVNKGYNGQDYKSTTYQVNIDGNSYYAQNYDGYNGEYTYVGNLWHDLLSEDVNGTVGGKSYCDEKNKFGQKCSMEDENCTDHISDARDDEVRRLEVTAYSRTINNKNAEILNGQKNKDELIKQTNMFADTAKLQVEIEHLKYVKENNKQELETSKYDNDKGIIKQTEYYIENKLNIDEENVSIVEDKTLLKRDNESHEIKINGIMIPYYIGNIDFGLEARPTTNISLTKLVSGIRVETADGEEILDVEYEPQYSEDGTLLLNENGVPTVENSVTTGAEHMQALNSSTTDIWGNTTDKNAKNQNGEKTNVVKQMYRNLKTTQGFYYINIDEDLMQGAVITLRYSIVVANESEVDTLGMLTGFGNGEQIYDEVLQILSNKDSEYVKYKANNKLPEYNGNKINKDTNQGMKYGYYTGATYYNGKYHPETYVVETRIDQIIDYVDNNLNVREEDNSTKDSSWRTVSLKELVEGEIQKDIVGQNWTENADHKTLNNTYSKTLSVIKSNENEETLKYVAYGSNGIKTIEVNNVGNMLSDKVYRKVFEENVEDKDLENELKNASVTGSITVNKDNDKIEDSTGKSVTILDSNAREYITEQRNNILLSIPEADKNPDLYKYLIPAKALTAKPENEDLRININKDMIDQNKVSSQIRIAMEYLIDKYNDKNSKFSKNLEGLKNCLDVNVYSELPEEYDQQIYEIARGKILELAQNTIEDKLSKYVYGTQNGSRFLENDNKYEKINGETSAKIKITATRTISPESTAEEREDLTFENLAEILQFSNEAGRRDEFATVGDAQVWEGAWKASTGYTPQGGIPEDSIDGGEDGGNTETNESVTKTKTKERYDTDTTEMVLLSPPTGLSQRELVELGTVKTQNNILLISVLTLTMTATIIIVIKISNRKKFYR